MIAIECGFFNKIRTVSSFELNEHMSNFFEGNERALLANKDMFDLCTSARKINNYQTQYLISRLAKALVEQFGENFSLVVVMRGGLPIVSSFEKEIYKIGGNTPSIGYISPNYLSNAFLDKFKEFVMLGPDNVVFLDGWISTGLTYQIMKNFFYSNLGYGKKFNFACLVNLSKLNTGDLISITDEDHLFYWNLLPTFFTGFTKFSLFDNEGITSAYYLSVEQREKIFYNLQKINESCPRLISVSEKNVNYRHLRNQNYKIGVNECLKAISACRADSIYLRRGSKNSKVLLHYLSLLSSPHNVFYADNIKIADSLVIRH